MEWRRRRRDDGSAWNSCTPAVAAVCGCHPSCSADRLRGTWPDSAAGPCSRSPLYVTRNVTVTCPSWRRHIGHEVATARRVAAWRNVHEARLRRLAAPSAVRATAVASRSRCGGAATLRCRAGAAGEPARHRPIKPAPRVRLGRQQGAAGASTVAFATPCSPLACWRNNTNESAPVALSRALPSAAAVVLHGVDLSRVEDPPPQARARRPGPAPPPPHSLRLCCRRWGAWRALWSQRRTNDQRL